MSGNTNTSEFHNAMQQRLPEMNTELDEMIANILKFRSKYRSLQMNMAKHYSPDNLEFLLEQHESFEGNEEQANLFEVIRKLCEVPPLAPDSPKGSDSTKSTVNGDDNTKSTVHFDVEDNPGNPFNDD